MKVVGHELGRVSYLVDLVEIGAQGGIAFGDLVIALRDRYGFAVLPKMPTQEAPQSVLRFEHGRLPEPMRGHVANFEMHPQGLVAQADDTNVADTFFTDLFAVGRKEFGLRGPHAHSMKIYNSSLVVDFETDINRLMSKWAKLSVLLAANIKKYYGVDVPTEVRGISFKPDPEQLPPRLAGGLLSDFTLERRTFAPFSSQRFYSIAPLPSDAHVEFLTELEEFAR